MSTDEARTDTGARQPPATPGPPPIEHDGNFDLQRITGLGKDLLDLVRLARSTGETPPSGTLRTQLGRAAYELRVALDWTNRIRGYPSHIDRFRRRNPNNPVAAGALSELWAYYWQVLHGLPDSRCPWPWQQPIMFTETEEARLTTIVETLEGCLPDDEVSGHGQRAEEAGATKGEAPATKSEGPERDQGGAEQAQPLSPLQYDILDALRSLKAIDPEKPANRTSHCRQGWWQQQISRSRRR